MGTQINFLGIDFQSRKRDNDWDKFYSVYKFDYVLYHNICIDINNKFRFFNFLIFNLPSFYIYLYIIYFNFIKNFKYYETYKVRKYCYILDEDGKKQLLSDEKHIYRIKTLQKIYLLLFEHCGFSPFANESVIKRLKCTPVENWTLWETATMVRIEELDKKGYTVHFDEEFGNQLEIKGTEMKSIKERLKAHISLLRRLKRGERL